MDTKAQDALVIIELYKLRCEPLMRRARAWFISEFAPQSGRQIVEMLKVPNIEKKLENRRKLLKAWARARAGGLSAAVGS